MNKEGGQGEGRGWRGLKEMGGGGRAKRKGSTR